MKTYNKRFIRLSVEIMKPYKRYDDSVENQVGTTFYRIYRKLRSININKADFVGVE